MKYSKELTSEICKYLSSGSNREDSRILCDVSESTFYEWLKVKPEFSEAVKKAERVFKMRNLAIIQRAAPKSWQAAAWLLERKYQDEFSVKQKVEHSGNTFGRMIFIRPEQINKNGVAKEIPTNSTNGHGPG